jgi:hypothetical protein
MKETVLFLPETVEPKTKPVKKKLILNVKRMSFRQQG